VGAAAAVAADSVAVGVGEGDADSVGSALGDVVASDDVTICVEEAVLLTWLKATMPPAPPSQPAVGTIRLTIQGSIWTANAITPRVRINGYPVPSRYGVQDLRLFFENDLRFLRQFA